MYRGLVMDNRGQLLLLSGLLIAMSITVISLYLTTASISGYRFSHSPWDLPYYEMRMSVYEAKRALKYYYNQTNGSSDLTESYALNFSQNMSKIYARHGYSLVVDVENVGNFYRLELTFKTDRVNMTVIKDVAGD
jgi:hypothetical protein